MLFAFVPYRGYVFFALASCFLAMVAGCQPGLEERAGEQSDSEQAALKINLAGMTRVQECGREMSSRGWGSEARPRDHVLENSVCAFVTANRNRCRPSPVYGGALIDANLHGAVDRMRALAPFVGSGSLPNVKWTDGCRFEPEEPDGASGFELKGHVKGDEDLLVRHRYWLAPESLNLTIETRVENCAEDSKSVLMGDLLLQGRTERFVRPLGLHPAGRSGKADWVVFFKGKWAWGLVPREPGRFFLRCKSGHTRILYGQIDLSPGETHNVRRELYVSNGGPQEVISAMERLLEVERTRFSIEVTDETSGAPVPSAYAILMRGKGYATSLIVTDKNGRGEAEVAAGSYRIVCGGPGRDRKDVPLNLTAHGSGTLRFKLAPPGRVRVRLNEGTDSMISSGAARLTIVPRKQFGYPLKGVPFFSELRASEIVLVPESGERTFRLPPLSVTRPGEYFVAASRGPEFEAQGKWIEVESGEVSELDFDLSRAIDTTGYAAVDFAQSAWEDPESVLSLKERSLLNLCERLDGVVIRGIDGSLRPRGHFEVLSPPRIPAAGGFVPGVGTFTVLASGKDWQEGRWRPRCPGLWGDDGETVIGLLRRHFPRSLLQVDTPLNRERGYFRLNGFVPGRRTAEAFSERFDCLRLLSGTDVAAARECLEQWFDLLNRGRRVVLTAGSGSKSLGDGHKMGARTWIRREDQPDDLSRENLIKDVERFGNTGCGFISNGPFVLFDIEGKGPGGTVQTNGNNLEAKIEVRCAKWISLDNVSLLQNGKEIRRFDVSERQNVTALNQKIKLDCQKDSWFAVLVRGEKGMDPVYALKKGMGVSAFAVTNPIRVKMGGEYGKSGR
ncbi:MAG: hypothetical protein ACLFWL_01305 [Candidatus Brocadiia bacterium]